jgi:UDP-glucose 4-epimerase
VSGLDGARVCVVGGAGFIGSHVVDLLVQEPVREVVVFDNFLRGRSANLEGAIRRGRVRVVEGDITRPKDVAAAVTGANYVVHLAALWLLECVGQPRAGLEVNVVGTFNVIDACCSAGTKKLVFSSSASVYGDAVEEPMTEDHPFNNTTFYGATKIAGEQFLQALHHTHGLPFAALRYMNAYGPRQDDRGAYTSVIIKVLDRIDRGLPPVIFGDGTATYDFVYVEDVARANILALTNGAPAGFYNIGSGVATTVNELVRELLDLTGSAQCPEYRPQAQVLVQRRIASIDLARLELGFEAAVPLRSGLERLIAWRKREKAAKAL